MDTAIELYRQQHARALQCVDEIAPHIESAAAAKAEAPQLRLSLAKLAGILRVHLRSEDMLLYPTLIANKDPKVSELARHFWEEMGGISDAITAFLETWRAVGHIEADPQLFVEGSQSIFAALKKRIEAEETELYPLMPKR